MLADAIRRRVADPEPVNLAYGSRVSLLELIECWRKSWARRSTAITSSPRAGDVHDSQADQTRLRALFPAIQPTPLPEGLKATVAWFRETL